MVKVPFQLPSGMANECQFTFYVQSFIIPQKLRGTTTYMVKVSMHVAWSVVCMCVLMLRLSGGCWAVAGHIFLEIAGYYINYYKAVSLSFNSLYKVKI